jgi:hypothetical protein
MTAGVGIEFHSAELWQHQVHENAARTASFSLVSSRSSARRFASDHA